MESGQNNVHSLVYDKAEIMKQKKNIAGLVSEIALPLAIIEANNLELVDVEYVKEGADMILRITIDTDAEGGITIDDCEKMHRAIDPLLDELDPIEESYMLSVSSPGVERELTKPMHYEKMKGSEVEVRLYAALDGSKVFRGELVWLEESEDGDSVVIKLPDGEEKKFPIKTVAKCVTVFNWD